MSHHIYVVCLRATCHIYVASYQCCIISMSHPKTCLLRATCHMHEQDKDAFMCATCHMHEQDAGTRRMNKTHSCMNKTRRIHCVCATHSCVPPVIYMSHHIYVAASPFCNISMSYPTYVATSPCRITLYVASSPCRIISMSQHLHVATYLCHIQRM